MDHVWKLKSWVRLAVGTSEYDQLMRESKGRLKTSFAAGLHQWCTFTLVLLKDAACKAVGSKECWTGAPQRTSCHCSIEVFFTLRTWFTNPSNYSYIFYKFQLSQLQTLHHLPANDTMTLPFVGVNSLTQVDCVLRSGRCKACKLLKLNSKSCIMCM